VPVLAAVCGRPFSSFPKFPLLFSLVSVTGASSPFSPRFSFLGTEGGGGAVRTRVDVHGINVSLASQSRQPERLTPTTGAFVCLRKSWEASLSDRQRLAPWAELPQRQVDRLRLLQVLLRPVSLWADLPCFN
jgi:hypothetical protein